MDKKIVRQLHADFERAAQKDEASGVEYWLARDLQKLLGYTQWRNFEKVIEKAIVACQNTGQNPENHFARVRKMVNIGSGGRQRFACNVALAYSLTCPCRWTEIRTPKR
ncbi:MAG: hypothetical protein LBP87_03810 [Planctomycetaceae bacterium]|jgi:DNA-damage-inducible protein D|nr:hypothetical protein [Planctomycetaceae bacterium]